MLKRYCTLVLLIFWAGAGAAQQDRPAGDFDYYVMALSWNAAWCEIDGDARGADQCDARHDHGFTLHGLWPQYESGWPAYCRTGHRDPSRGDTGAMADIMGSSGSAWHQWKKHGRCSGLSAGDYFALARVAYAGIDRPGLLRQVDAPLKVPPAVVEAAFLESNPGLTADGVTVTCKQGYIQEVRICLTRDLHPRACAPDVRQDCRSRGPIFLPMR